MPALSPLPESLRGGAFAVQDARELGIPAKRLRARDLQSPFRAVRTLELDWEDIDAVCAAYSVCLTNDQLFSHVTAARLYRVPLPYRLEQRRSIDVWAPTIQVRCAGVIGHRSAALARKWVAGFPVVEPARAWLQLGPLLDHVSLVAAGDHLVRRKYPLCTLGGLEAVVESGRGIRGIRRLRAALADVRPGTDSPMESRLRLALVAAGLPEPVIGHTIFDGAGGFVGTPDLAYLKQRIAIEYEGEHHQTDPVTFAADIERRERMQESDWYVIRVVKDHIHPSSSALVSRVARILSERAHRS